MNGHKNVKECKTPSSSKVFRLQWKSLLELRNQKDASDEPGVETFVRN